MDAARASEAKLRQLRQQISALEGIDAPACAPASGAERHGAEIERAGWLPFGINELDQCLGGGLPRAALHEFRSAETRSAGLLAGFGAALLASLAGKDRRPFLWVIEAEAEREGGGFYGPGLAALGLDPGRVLLVRTRKPEEALWAFEEGLRCRGLLAVVGQLQGHPRALDLTALRRLAIRAREEGVMGLLLRQAAEAEPGAALTRFRVGPRSSAPPEQFAGLGEPAWRLDLERNRLGPTGSFEVEWDHESGKFALLHSPPLSLARPLPAADGQVPAPRLRPEVALRLTG